MQLDGRGKTVTATPAWTTRDMVCHHGGYVIHDGYIYGNHSESWVCLELRSGQQQWRTRGVGKGSVCYADGMLYLFAEDGGRAALATCSPAGLDLRGTVTVEGEENSWAHPVVIGGRLYLRYADNLYCFNVQAPGGER
jgi:outer membrane protein assembly factor BamB